MGRRWGWLVGSFTLVGFIALSVLVSQSAWAAAFVAGDVFAGTSDGTIKEFHSDGTLYQTLTTGFTVGIGGMAFDASGDLLATQPAGNQVSKFSHSTGLMTGTFGIRYNAEPESIVVASSSAYVGQGEGTRHIKQFTYPGGTFVADFAPAVENHGTDWIDLGPDGSTMYYTSHGTHVKRFDVAASTQLLDLNVTALPGVAAYALRVLPSSYGALAGDVLVADTDRVVLLNAAGVDIKEYLSGEPGVLFALNLDPNGQDFWAAGLKTGQVYEVNIATGAIDENWSAGPPGTNVGGLAVFGEVCTTCGVVPEPGTLQLFASALVGLGALRGFRAGRILGHRST